MRSRAASPTRRLRLDALPNIAENYKSQPPALWGIQQIRKKGLRDWGGTLAAGEAHPIAVGAETLALRMERTAPTR
jgi:O-acetylhomoserine (thiol)-lyase